MDVLWHPVPLDYYGQTFQASRSIVGIGLHDTETDTLAAPHAGGSWTYEIDRAGSVHGYVPEADIAYHVKAWGTDPSINKWRPAWLPLSRPWGASATNCWTLGIELVSSKKYRDQGRPYTQAQYRALQLLVLDLRARYGPLPIFGHGHVQSDRRDPLWFDWATVLPVLPEIDALMPLDGAVRAAPLLGGYAFAERQSDGVYHPGVDLNAGSSGDADLGAPVRTPADVIVRKVLPWDGHTTGFGNHVWLEATDGHWLHLCHLHTLACQEGERLSRRTLVGTCGKTGNWQFAHTHWEVLYQQPTSWTQWPTGWSKDRVLAEYMDPFAYLAATWPGAEETGEDTPEMEEPVLNDAELAHKLQAKLWGNYFSDATVDFAIPTRWRAEFRKGNQLGRPVGPETDVPDVTGAVFQEFDSGKVIVYRDGRTSLIG